MNDPKASEYKDFAPIPEPTQLTTAPPGQGHLIPTGPDILGPFYKVGAPKHREFVALVEEFNLTVHGRILDQKGDHIDDAVIDWWQCDEYGKYDNKNFYLRARIEVGDDGNYKVETVKPGFYDISEPNDPEPHDFRCSHLHLKVTATGYKQLVTQLYFPDSDYNSSDPYFNDKRTVEYEDTLQEEAVFDIVMEKV